MSASVTFSGRSELPWAVDCSMGDALLERSDGRLLVPLSSTTGLCGAVGGPRNDDGGLSALPVSPVSIRSSFFRLLSIPSTIDIAVVAFRSPAATCTSDGWGFGGELGSRWVSRISSSALGVSTDILSESIAVELLAEPLSLFKKMIEKQ